jgi:hypothetical protein
VFFRGVADEYDIVWRQIAVGYHYETNVVDDVCVWEWVLVGMSKFLRKTLLSSTKCSD